MRYSFSSLKCFERCPKAFKYQYVDKVKVDYFQTIEAFMGGLVHESLEKFYKDRQEGHIAGLEGLIDHYNDNWAKSVSEAVVVNRAGATRDDFRLAGEKCLADYYFRHTPFDKGKTVATEMLVNVDLFGDGRCNLVGFIDRVDLADGMWQIHDYKTSSSLPRQETLDKDKQLGLYELGLRQAYDGVGDVELVWHYLMFDRRIRSSRTKEGLDKLKMELLQMILRIDEALLEDYFPPLKSGLCRYCEYQGICDDGKPLTKQSKLV